MNNQLIVQKFALMANLTIDEASSWAETCFECASKVNSKKIPGISQDDENIFLVPLAAAMAFYSYNLYKASNLNEEDFKVGDISVRKNTNANVNFAKQALENALASAAHYLRDDDFAFWQVSS